MNDEGTVVELTFEGDDRVFLSSPTFALWRRKIRQPPLTLHEGPGMPVRLDPRLTMAMFRGGAPIDQFLAHLREQAERTDAEQAFIDTIDPAAAGDGLDGCRLPEARLKVVIKINRHRWGSVGLRGLSCALLQIVEDVGHYLEAPS